MARPFDTVILTIADTGRGGHAAWGCPDVEQIVTERVTALLEARLRQRDNLQKERSARFVRLGSSLAENEDESAIVAMLLDDYYQQTLHAPVVQPASPREESQQRKPPPSNHSRRRRRR